MDIECQTKVDYLQQARKTTRPSTKGLTVYKERGSVILQINNSAKTSFNLEESLSKYYASFIHEGKMTLEMVLPGGTFCNILISKASPELLTKLYSILKVVLESPQDIIDLDLASNKPSKDDEAIEV
ncbi:hypothetical protein PPL_05034 [Heterostelium album PN500]|uniref:PIF1/LRR1 pleckstrin homology domain-containing protein n=1 Tax=Heterostelium pallidum (strain ATCC 26659 / Pp 5 / PN500) TaxID=670386 RepID=D3B990_HETP5|nr:hypothetical protein PPL_05034 [Heterostelium album PN500]EFA82129.1 hypothetical protein PPL_05034 [Heterostelium album PN500]|eukprot:XP_020434246.1 hypothetical protein PPL_05034 [Heterostelium album PN500]